MLFGLAIRVAAHVGVNEMSIEPPDEFREIAVAVATAIVIAGAVFCALALVGEACGAELAPGTILVSRNANEADNTSPGFWNHLAIVAGANEVIESQAGQGVIRTPLAVYMARPYRPILALKPLDCQAGQRAAARADELVGLPHRALSSLFVFNGQPRRKIGVNCVTAALEIPYAGEALGVRLTIKPDGVLRTPFARRLFSEPVTIRP